jgi:aspartate aminotransferase
MVSKRVQSVPASGTIEISNMVSRMKASGDDIISFSMGEPDFVTPSNIIEAAVGSLHDGFTHYTPSLGIIELREAIVDRLKTSNNIVCTPGNVLVTPCKQAIFMTALGFLDPGDEVILPDPSWVSYEACIRLAGAIPVYVSTRFEDNFVINPELIRAAITPKTRMIFMNTPSNPTGCVYPADTIKAVAEIAIEHDLMVMSDEIYESIVYEGRHLSIASLPDMFDRTITVSGLSKTYAMTGWRLGWAVASEPNIAALNKLQSHSISCCVSFTQTAAIEALNGPQDERYRMVREFKERRDLALDLISEIDGLECNVPNGAFYLFPRYSTEIKATELAADLLRHAHVAVTPGTAFGPSGEGFFRISYAASEEHIREGLGRIKKYMAENL